MPVDKNGVRADIVADDISTIKRSNLGRVFEQYIGSACMEVKFNLRAMYGLERFTNYNLDKILDILNGSDNTNAFNYLVRFYQISNENFANYIVSLSAEDKIEHLAHVIKEGPYLHIPTDTQKPHMEMVKEIESEFKPLYDVVKIRNQFGQEEWTKNKVRIGPVYMMLLEKIADSWSTLSSGKLQHFGVLSSGNKTEKHATPMKRSAVRVVSESDGRIYAAYTSAEAVAELMDRNNNPLSHREIVKTILTSEKPGHIREAVNRDIVELGNVRPNQLLNHMFLCYGFKFKHFDSNQEYK